MVHGSNRHCAVLLLGGLSLLVGNSLVLAQGLHIRSVYPGKPRYLPGGPGDPPPVIKIHVEIENGDAMPHSGEVLVDVFRLHVAQPGAPPAKTFTSLLPGTSLTLDFDWTAPPKVPTAPGDPPTPDFAGYLVRGTIRQEVTIVDTGYTAIDISSDWRRYPRYGFLTRFLTGQTPAKSRAIIEQVTRDYHLTALQYYDWMWRHEKVIERTIGAGVVADPWEDWNHDLVSKTVLDDLVQVCDELNVASLPYSQVYFALKNTFVPPHDVIGVQKAWALFKEPAAANLLDWGAWFLFNPLHDGWRNHIVQEYADAIQTVKFDGVHIDQLGRAINQFYWDSSGNQVDLNVAFPGILNRAAAAVRGSPAVTHQQKATVFNLVGGKVDHLAHPHVIDDAHVDFLYSEVWNSDTYNGVHRLVRWARNRSGGKPMVLAAYVNKDEVQAGSGVPCGPPGSSLKCFDEDSVRLADAAFFASGAFHIELGDGDRMLSLPEFYKTPLDIDPSLKETMRSYYSFITAYQDLLFSHSEPDLFYGDAGTQWIDIPGFDVSASAEANNIWYLSRRSHEREIVHLINLRGNDDKWRNFADTPTPVPADTVVKYRLGPHAGVSSIHVASPDQNGGMSQPIGIDAVGTDSVGDFVQFRIPELLYWQMIYIGRTFTPPADPPRYEAEAAIKTLVAVDSTIAGHSGTGYVDSFTSGPGTPSLLSFYVHLPEHSGYGLDFRYANASTSEARPSIFIDGEARGRLTFPPVVGGSGWSHVHFDLHARPGIHQVVLHFDTPHPAVALDYIQTCLPTGGLKAEYYASKFFKDFGFAQTDRAIAFEWGSGSPDLRRLNTSFPSSHFSVRWTGQFVPLYGETYTFYARTDDGVRLWIGGDDDPLIASWVPQTAGFEHVATYPVPLVAGTSYDIRMDYFEQTGAASARLSWSSASQAKEVIPEERLFPSRRRGAFGTPVFRRGDVNLDFSVDLSDAVAILNSVSSGTALPCEKAADIDDDGVVAGEDASSLMSYLFAGGAVPACPFPHCGRDVTPDTLTCGASDCE